MTQCFAREIFIFSREVNELILEKYRNRPIVVKIFFNKMDISPNAEKKITPVYILLPFYTELKLDVFVTILKKVVSRKKSSDDYVVGAFTSGMSAKTLFIESEDLLVNCNDEISMPQLIRLVKLLGFWAVNNFPSLGRKLLGEIWMPSKERTVNIGNQKIMDDKQMDATMFQKFKLRVIELSVSDSTWVKVKHFVDVPASVCEASSDQISKKMKMFDIQDAYIDDCWQALKVGKLTVNVNFEVSFL